MDTKHGSGDPNAPCIFPFKFNGKTYNSCTLDNYKENRAWCSTMVDETGKHVSGRKKWGVCGPDCPLPGKSKLQCYLKLQR